jgi:hypothetical protein
MNDYVGLYIRVKDDDYLGAVKQAIDVKRIELNELGIRGREFATKKLSYQAILQNLKLVMK